MKQRKNKPDPLNDAYEFQKRLDKTRIDDR